MPTCASDFSRWTATATTTTTVTTTRTTTAVKKQRLRQMILARKNAKIWNSESNRKRCTVVTTLRLRLRLRQRLRRLAKEQTSHKCPDRTNKVAKCRKMRTHAKYVLMTSHLEEECLEKTPNCAHVFQCKVEHLTQPSFVQGKKTRTLKNQRLSYTPRDDEICK